MPRAKRPVRYPTICFRIAGLCESRTEDFDLSFSQQREAIDTRQMLYSFSRACDLEATREQKGGHLTEAKRWHDIYAAFGRWVLVVDPPYDKTLPQLLDAPAALHFQLRDRLPKHAQLDSQLDQLEAASAPPADIPDMDDVYSRLGIQPPSNETDS